MNIISHKRLIIEFDVWEPNYDEFEKEYDNIIDLVKTGKLLNHTGNTKLTLEHVSETKTQVSEDK